MGGESGLTSLCPVRTSDINHSTGRTGVGGRGGGRGWGTGWDVVSPGADGGPVATAGSKAGYSLLQINDKASGPLVATGPTSAPGLRASHPNDESCHVVRTHACTSIS